MAKRPDEYTLYDIAPAFQNKLAAWLSKTNVVIDIGVGDGRAFRVAFDPWGTEVGHDSFEEAIDQAMKSRSKKKYIDRELEQKIHEFLKTTQGHITFGAKNGIFDVVVSNADARGMASDEDLEFAMVLAEEQFWGNMPENPLAAGDREALQAAVMGSPAARAEEQEDAALAGLHRALFVPRPELEANAGMRRKRSQWSREYFDAVVAEVIAQGGEALTGSTRDEKPEDVTEVVLAHGEVLAAGYNEDAPIAMVATKIIADETRYQRGELQPNRRPPYAEWVSDVDEELTAIGGRFDDADPAYWRQMYQAGFGSSEAVQEFGSTRLDVLERNAHPQRTVSRPQRPGTFGHVPPPPPSRIEGRVRREARDASRKPFDPYAPREHYARSHHFAVNMDPDAALRRYWDAIDDGDITEARGAKADLVEWIERGGFEPDWAESGHSRQEFLALTGASMRSRHGSPHGVRRANVR